MDMDMMKILAIDAGTSSVKFGVFDERYRMLMFHKEGLGLRVASGGSATQDLREIFVKVLRGLRLVARRFGDVDLIVLGTQMHGLSLLDKNFDPITPLITYLDRRAGWAIPKMIKLVDPYKLYLETGCPILYIYPLAKIIWMKERHPSLFDRCRYVSSLKEYIVLGLTGEFALDYSVASGSQLLDIKGLRWSNLALGIAGIGERTLPELVDGAEDLFYLKVEVAREAGFKERIPLIVGGSDGALHSLGAGAVSRGYLALNLGTSGAIRGYSHSPVFDKDERARFFCYYLAKKIWIPGGAINNGGIVLRWLLDGMFPDIRAEARKKNIDEYKLLLDRAADDSKGLIFLPFISGERFPVRDSKARGLYLGLTLEHSRAELIRATLEGPMLALRWILDAMAENSIGGEAIRVGGGGARLDGWLQIAADVLGMPIERPSVTESSLLGSAILGFVKLGAHKSLGDAVEEAVAVSATVFPSGEKEEMYRRKYEVFKSAYECFRNIWET